MRNRYLDERGEAKQRRRDRRARRTEEREAYVSRAAIRREANRLNADLFSCFS